MRFGDPPFSTLIPHFRQLLLSPYYHYSFSLSVLTNCYFSEARRTSDFLGRPSYSLIPLSCGSGSPNLHFVTVRLLFCFFLGVPHPPFLTSLRFRCFFLIFVFLFLRYQDLLFSPLPSIFSLMFPDPPFPSQIVPSPRFADPLYVPLWMPIP